MTSLILCLSGTCGMQDPDVPATCTVYNNCSPFIQLVANVRRPVPPELTQYDNQIIYT